MATTHELWASQTRLELRVAALGGHERMCGVSASVEWTPYLVSAGFDSAGAGAERPGPGRDYRRDWPQLLRLFGSEDACLA